MDETRHLHLRGALGTVRTEKIEDQEYLIVPVVALMDGVIHAVNASTPERVTAETLAKAAQSWNGRPLVLGHPTKNGRQCSANEPGIKASHHFGLIYNSRMQGSKLLMDAYVDPVRAEKIGGPDFVKKLRNGEQIEVSVGAYVQTKPEEGIHNGRPYKAAWLETHGDHLAFLPGGKGACSIEMGCGAHRAAQMHLVTAEEFKILGGPGSGNHGHSGRPGQVGGSAGSTGGSGGSSGGGSGDKKSMQQTEDFVSAALDASAKARKSGSKEDHQAAALAHNEVAGMYEEEAREHGYDTAEGEKAQLLSELHSKAEWAHEFEGGNPDIEGLDEGEDLDTVVKDIDKFTAMPPREVSKIVNVGGEASRSSKESGGLPHDAGKDDSVDAPPKSPWYQPQGNPRSKKKPRGASSRDCSVCDGTGQIKNEQKQQDCPSCGGSGTITAAETNDGTAVEEAQMKKVDAIKTLTSCPCSGFVAADAKELEAFSEERLTAMAEATVARKVTLDKASKDEEELKAEKEKNIKAAAEIVELKAAAAKQPTEEEYLAKAPESIRTLVAEKKAADAKVKADLVAQLKTAASGAFTEAELNEKSISELMKLAQMAKVQPTTDYSGRNIPMRAAGEASSYTPPDPYAAGLKARQAVSN